MADSNENISYEMSFSRDKPIYQVLDSSNPEAETWVNVGEIHYVKLLHINSPAHHMPFRSPNGGLDIMRFPAINYDKLEVKLELTLEFYEFLRLFKIDDNLNIKIMSTALAFEYLEYRLTSNTISIQTGPFPINVNLEFVSKTYRD